MKERKTEHPILFSTPMVQAIQEGRKTMTRRIFKDHPRLASDISKVDLKKWFEEYPDYIKSFCPYGQIGDKLWVRETWCKSAREWYFYKAGSDENKLRLLKEEGFKWKPSIHMPKSAARIWLEVTDIRVERLQDISEEDAKVEGIEFLEQATPYTYGFKLYGNHSYLDILGRKARTGMAIESFETLWQEINGTESWNSNPWVWVIEFKRIEPCH